MEPKDRFVRISQPGLLVRVQGIALRIDVKWWLLAGLILMCCAYEVGRVLHLRPQAHHMWRQTDCISLAWNYYDTTWNFFEPAIHNQFADQHTSGRSAGELPLLYYIVGILWRITGPSEFLYRLIGLLIHAAGSFALFGVVRRLTQSGFWAVTLPMLFFTSPVLLYYGIAFLTDVPALDMALIGWWFLVRHAQERGRWHLPLAVIFFTLGMLLKMTAGMSLVALTAILFFGGITNSQRRAPDPVFGPRLRAWGWIIAGYATVFAWYAYAAWYNGKHGAKYTFNDLWPLWGMFPEAIESAWRVGCDIIVFQVFDTSIWIFLGAAALFLAANPRSVGWRALVLVGLLIIGTVAYTLMWFNALQDHDYYFINPMITLVALSVVFLWWLCRVHPDIARSRWARATMLALLAFNTLYAAQNLRMRYDTTSRMTARDLWPIYHERELDYWNLSSSWGMEALSDLRPKLMDLGIKPEDKVIYPDDVSFNSALILLGRRGWTGFGMDMAQPGVVDELVAKGARFFICKEAHWASEPALKDHLVSPVAHVLGMNIYELGNSRNKTIRIPFFDQVQRSTLPGKHHVDTIQCPIDTGWCFLPNEFPLGIEDLPMRAPDVRLSELRITGVLDHQLSSVPDISLQFGEDDETKQVAISSFPLQKGPFDVRFWSDRTTYATSNTLFIWNRGLVPFRISDLRIEVVQHHDSH